MAESRKGTKKSWKTGKATELLRKNDVARNRKTGKVGKYGGNRKTQFTICGNWKSPFGSCGKLQKPKKTMKSCGNRKIRKKATESRKKHIFSAESRKQTPYSQPSKFNEHFSGCDPGNCPLGVQPCPLPLCPTQSRQLTAVIMLTTRVFQVATFTYGLIISLLALPLSHPGLAEITAPAGGLGSDVISQVKWSVTPQKAVKR